VHITGEQADTDTNLTPLQFTILSEKLAAANYVSYHIVIMDKSPAPLKSSFVALHSCTPVG
jgi:hypothetical protein